MAFRDASGKEKIVILSNALIRFTQLIVVAAALGLYGTQKSYWLDHDIPNRISYDLAVGALASITALALFIIPFFMSYRIVAFAAFWDLLLAIMWGAAFGLMKAIFLHPYIYQDIRFEVNDSDAATTEGYKRFVNHWKTMMDGAWINLAGLILFLISAAMGFILLCIGRRSAGSARGGKASYV